MKITLEASPILHTLTGIGRYTWELATRLPYHPMIEELSLYVRNEIVRDPNKIIRMAKEVKSYPLWSKPLRLTSRYLKKRYALHVCENSLVHGPNYFLPSCAERGIITVHDLSVFRYPETHPIERVKQFEMNFDDSLKRSQYIITDSEAMKREIIELIGWKKDKISVVLLGVAPEFTPRHYDHHYFLEKFSLDAESYSLCVATIEPRKNIDKLVSAYKVLPKQLRKRFPLVIIGGNGWNSDTIIEQIQEGVREGWIIRPGFVSEEELVLFYSHAALFVYPSAYEGFGLPVIEAMACGIPVIISNRTSLPEVAGEYALIIDPDNHEEFVNALQHGLEDEQWRHNAIQDGLEVVKKYTWEKCIDETVKIYSSNH